jgi:uncharacterized protein (DUF433 family)
MPDALTAAQAAFVLGEPLESFNKIVERGPVKARVIRRGGIRLRQFGLGDLVFLYADRELRSELTRKGREELYEALVRLPRHGSKHEVAFGHFRFDYGRHLTAIEAKLNELDELSSEIDSSGREAVIKGTKIEAHRIAALLDGGMTVEAILHDYPSLKGRQVVAAKAYADANPKPGRPYPKTTAKAAMRRADLDELEGFLSPPE